MESTSLLPLTISRYVAYIGAFIVSILLLEGNIASIVSFSILYILILIISSLRIYKFNNNQRAIVITCIAEIILIITVQYFYNSSVFILLYVMMVDIYLFLSIKKANGVSILLYIALFLCFMLFMDKDSISSLITNYIISASIMIFFAGATRIARKERETRTKLEELYSENRKASAELEEAHKKLTEYAKQVEDITSLNERNRIAGEIHDTLGHSLTALIMEIDICQKLINKDLDKTKEELKKASTLARSTLGEIRKSVRAIKPENIEEMMGIHAIEELIRDFEKNTRILINFNVTKNRYKLPPTIDVTIYRIIQEALTNCAKHSGGDRITINLNFMEGSLELNIEDNGSGCDSMVPGVGLKTMKERITALGGSINLKTHGGFGLSVNIPVEVL